MEITIRNKKMAMAAKILLKKDNRDYVSKMMVKDGFAYCTNGNCLVKIATDIKDGFYRPIKITKTFVELQEVESFEYPDIESVLNFESHISIKNDVCLETFNAAFATITRATDPDYCYDPDLLKIGYNITDECYCQDVLTASKLPLALINDDITFILMPVKI